MLNSQPVLNQQRNKADSKVRLGLFALYKNSITKQSIVSVKIKLCYDSTIGLLIFIKAAIILCVVHYFINLTFFLQSV